MEGRAGAESTQAPALNCMIPPSLAFHPRLDRCGLGFPSLIPDRAPDFLFVSCTYPNHAGASFELGLARGL